MIQVWRVAAKTKEEARDAMRSILEGVAGGPVEIRRQAQGKPYLPAFPHIRFNLSHSKGRALVAVALDIEVGVDIERLRPVPNPLRVAERFLPPGDAEELAELTEADREWAFFRRWTRAEALWKAAGLGLYSAGATPDGEWHAQDLDAGEGYVAAVAANREGIPLEINDFGVDI